MGAKMLNYTLSGDDNGLPPVLVVHGLFGSGKNLGGIARRLSPARQVILVDMRNHGDSFRDPQQNYPAMADDLAEVIEAFGGKADVVGHSMGGKAAMVLALTCPETVGRLVILDIAPVTYGHSQSGLIDAMQAMDLTGLKLRSEADRRLSERIKDPGVRAFLLQSLDLKTDPPHWKLNLDVLRQDMDRLTGWPEGLKPGGFAGRSLFLAGANSDYCASEGVTEIHRYFPQAEVEFIPDTGHWLHAEQPVVVADRIAEFLS